MKKYLSLPEPLQRQVLLRFGLAAVLLIVGLTSAILWQDWSMLVILVAALFFAVLGIWIAWREYVVITGVCSETDATIIRKRTKAIVLHTELQGKEVRLRIPLRQQFRKIVAGDHLEIYADAATMIYERDGIFHLQSYIAIDRRGTL